MLRRGDSVEQGKARWAESAAETEEHLRDPGTIADRPPYPRARALQPRHRQQVALVRFGQAAREGRLLWKRRRVAHDSHAAETQRPVQFEITEQTRESLATWDKL